MDYETHYTESMLDAMQVPKRLRAAGRRDEATNITAWEVAIHREDLMYPDWAGREASGASRWQAGTTIGFSFLANEGLEAAVGDVGDGGSAGVLQAGWAGYYPHVSRQSDTPLLRVCTCTADESFWLHILPTRRWHEFTRRCLAVFCDPSSVFLFFSGIIPLFLLLLKLHCNRLFRVDSKDCVVFHARSLPNALCVILSTSSSI